jgi:hypothetical protein
MAITFFRAPQLHSHYVLTGVDAKQLVVTHLQKVAGKSLILRGHNNGGEESSGHFQRKRGPGEGGRLHVAAKDFLDHLTHTEEVSIQGPWSE